ncbi:alpha/beta fold hydrolase [Paenibacillus sp. MCAF20]
MDENGFAYESVKIQTLDGELRYIVSGDKQAQPIVFLHGITEYAKSFLPVMKLMPKSFYCVAVDLRGRGESFKPEEGYTLRDYTNDLLAVMNSLSGHAQRPILVGHSLSGRIAAAFAAEHPQLISAMVLIDPPISGPGRRSFPPPLSRFTGPKEAIEAGDMEAFAAFYANTKMDVSLKAEELRACAMPAIVQSYRSMNVEPFHSHYRRITTRALLLAAELSPLITNEELYELRQMNAYVKVKRLPGIGHEIYKEDPKLFVSEVLYFLDV